MIKSVLLKIIRFFYRLLSKIIYLCIPYISRILMVLRLNSRIINQLNKVRSECHKTDDHTNFISELLKKDKLIALDVGAQGGFFNAGMFSEGLSLSKVADCYAAKIASLKMNFDM